MWSSLVLLSCMLQISSLPTLVNASAAPQSLFDFVNVLGLFTSDPIIAPARTVAGANGPAATPFPEPTPWMPEQPNVAVPQLQPGPTELIGHDPLADAPTAAVDLKPGPDITALPPFESQNPWGHGPVTPDDLPPLGSVDAPTDPVLIITRTAHDGAPVTVTSIIYNGSAEPTSAPEITSSTMFLIVTANATRSRTTVLKAANTTNPTPAANSTSKPSLVSQAADRARNTILLGWVIFGAAAFFAFGIS